VLGIDGGAMGITETGLTLEYGGISVGGGQLSFGASTRYQSALLADISPAVPTVPGFTTLQLRASYDISSFTIRLFADNVTNALGITSFTSPAVYGNRYGAIVSRPRTVGMSVQYLFRGK
jgi:outer membrane receptor protein involved in Fe transport